MKRIISWLKQINRKKLIIISMLLVAAIAAGVFAAGKLKGNKASAEVVYAEAEVTRDDVSVTISGSGTVEPISRYEIIALVKGEILESRFEEGAAVNEGDILYRIDSTDLQNSIQKQYNSMERTQITANTNADNIANLKVRAPSSGTLTEFSVKVNDTINAAKAATIINSQDLTVTVPFNASQISKIRTGDRVTVTSAAYMTTIDGSVSYVSDVVGGSSDGSTLYDVEITLRNPGALTGGISVGATVHTSSGDVKSPVSGTVDNSEATSVIPKVSGKVTKVNVRNNQYVRQGDVLFELDGTDYAQAQRRTNLELQDLQLSLESQYKELDNYNIKSPISGTVITKNYKVGDTIGNSQNSSATLMTVADMSKMVFNLEVDELEISKIRVGLKADITADALPDAAFEATVSKVANEGVSSNGVTTYSVELIIDEPGSLMSGMNVNAEIIVEQSADTLVLPIAAVSNVRGGMGFVLMKVDDAPEMPDMSAMGGMRIRTFDGDGEFAVSPEGERDEAVSESEGMPRRRIQGEGGEETSPVRGDGERPVRINGEGERPIRIDGEGERASRGDGAAVSGGTAPANGNTRAGGMTMGGAPEGYVRVPVVLGLSGTDTIEILEGLNEGDKVYYVAATPDGSGMGMNMSMGGMPMGGMSGGAMRAAPMGGGGGGATFRMTR